jgi:hypothetical protein
MLTAIRRDFGSRGQIDRRCERIDGGDKLTVTVERIDGGKLRCTGATWSDAVVIFPGEVLAFQNIERQAHALRVPAPGGVVQTSRRHPRSGEDDFEVAPDEGGRHPPIW